MNYEKFRRSGELSDITVIVDKSEFKLHTFPLFTKSDFFKKAVASLGSTSLPYVLRLDNDFPGGAQVFNQIADYFYSLPISIDQKNLVALRSAAAFVQCDELGIFIDKRFDEILRLSRARYDLTLPLVLLEQCLGEFEIWAKQTKMIDRCLQAILDSLIRGAGLQLTKSDREIIVRLPLEWILQLINLCSPENRSAILPITKHFLSVWILEQNPPTQNSSVISTQNGNEHQSAFTPVQKKDDLPTLSNGEKRDLLDQIVKALDTTLSLMPLTWLNSLYEKAMEFNCNCQGALAAFLTQSLLHANEIDDGIEHLPDDVMTTLLERITKHKDEQIKDPQTLAKLSTLIDTYVEQLRQRGTLTSEQFIKLASCVPKEQRNSHDSLLLALDEILKNEKSTQLSDSEREELLNQIDFSRVNEDTISICKENKLIPQKLITEASLSLCVKLRRQLDEARNRLRVVEHELSKTRVASGLSTYRPRQYETTSRITPSRSRLTYTSAYEPAITTSAYTYLKYDGETDLDSILPSRYLATSALGRYGGSYYNYRY